MKRKKRGGYRLLYAYQEDAQFIDYLSECMRVDKHEVVRLAISLLAPDESYQLFSKVLERIETKRSSK